MFDGVVDFDGVVGVVAALTDEALVERFRELERSARRGEAELAVVVAELEERSVFVPDGHASMRGWLKATVRWSNQECSRRLQTARLVVADRAVAARLHVGEAGVAQVQELARAHANPCCGAELVGAAAKTLLDHAGSLSFEDFRLCVRRWELLADVDGAHRDAEAVVERRTATVVEFDGVLHVGARGGAAHAASMVEIFQRFCDAEFAAAFAGHVRRVVFDSAGVVIDMGRKRRLFAGSAREAVFLQSSRCIWPGCCLPSGRCQADHADEWMAHQGATRPGNGAPLCGRHNRWKNKGFRTRRDDDGHWHIYRPDGTAID